MEDRPRLLEDRPEPLNSITKVHRFEQPGGDPDLQGQVDPRMQERSPGVAKNLGPRPEREIFRIGRGQEDDSFRQDLRQFEPQFGPVDYLQRLRGAQGERPPVRDSHGDARQLTIEPDRPPDDPPGDHERPWIDPPDHLTQLGQRQQRLAIPHRILSPHLHASGDAAFPTSS